MVHNGKGRRNHIGSYHGVQGLVVEEYGKLVQPDMGMDGGEEGGGDSLEGLNGRVKVVVGMHKGKSAQHCMDKGKEGEGMDLNLVVVGGMHRDCGLGMKMRSHNYPLTNTKFGVLHDYT
jgi:hypothetical protein